MSKNPADEVLQWDIEKVVPYARNSRTHGDAQVAQIAASIREWGFTTPVLIDEKGGIIAGHGRVMAAKKLGLGQIPVVIASGWSDAKKRAYVIADNKLALNAGWDDEMLRLELLDLQDAGFDLDLTSFDAGEIEALLSGADAEPLDGMPSLPDGDREPFQQMTFTLHDEQVATVKEAMDAARALGPFVDTGNENGNGNALARVCETFLTQNG